MKKMIFLLFIVILLNVRQNNSQINLYSDINLSNMGTKFQPANSIELFSTSFAATFVACGQCKFFHRKFSIKFFIFVNIVCNQNSQCRTFDYDSISLVCNLYEGAIETGSIVASGSLTSSVGSVRLQSNFFAAFGQDCSQCQNSRYLVCSSNNNNNTCQCPKGTFWNGNQCKNQGYEDTNCSNNQWCRQDLGMNCSKLQFCTRK